MRVLIAVLVASTKAAPWAAPEAQYRNGAMCSATTDFPVDLTGWQYKGLKQEKDASDVPSCAQKCCDMGPACLIWQFNSKEGCWVGAKESDPYPDPDHKYQSRGRNLSPPAPTPPPTPMPQPKGPYALDDTPGLGLRWEGVGAISGGGATTKLLMDYDKDVASDVLDFLFKPGFGLNLQMLKVEVGGDTDATEGAEPSHMHSANDENYQRGYEWWLMKEAKARNPDIKLYGLPWGWPGWLDPSAGPDKQAKNAFANPNVTANYTLNWLLGAKREHDLDIDYIGQWNERDAPADYNNRLREVVADSGLKTTCLNRLPHYPGTTEAMDKQGCTQYDWNTTDGSRWVDEEGSIYDGRSARCLARCVNRNYVSGCHTATFQWHLVSSFYDYLPWSRCGVAVANRPWDGSYEITSPTWALAHTSQFAPVGWRYAKHGFGVTMLEHGGSMVTRISPDKKDFSVVIEKMSSKNSTCARGSNPSSDPEEEDVVLTLKGSFARAKSLNVWFSDMSSGNGEGGDQNPPDAQVFQKLAPVTVAADGTITLKGVKPDTMYTLTTLSTGSKGKAGSTATKRSAFPIPFSQDFDKENISSPPALWYDQMGAWEVQEDESKKGNRLMRQVSPVWPACWGYSCTGPTTYFGPSEFNHSTTVAVDVKLEDTGSWTLATEGGSSVGISLHTDGSWSLVDGKSTKASGKDLSFTPNSWHTVELQIGQSYYAALFDGQVLSNQTNTGTRDGYRFKVSMDRYIFAAMDNFKISAL